MQKFKWKSVITLTGGEIKELTIEGSASAQNAVEVGIHIYGHLKKKHKSLLVISNKLEITIEKIS